MHPGSRIWTSQQSPITRLMEGDDHLIPDHIREVTATPPRGYLATPRNKYCHLNPGMMFVTKVPASRDDADQYLASMHHPHTRKTALLRRAAAAPLPSAGQFYALMLLTAATFIAYFSYAQSADTLAATIITYACIAMCGTAVGDIIACLGIIGADAYVDAHYETYAPHAPTALMRDITTRSIDVTAIDARLAKLAWDVYRYDVDHYDELVVLIHDMRENPAERGSKTYGVYQQIIDTFRQASELRQEATRQALNDRKTAHEARRLAQLDQARAHERMVDEMRADMLETTVLARLRAQASAAETLYGETQAQRNSLPNRQSE